MSNGEANSLHRREKFLSKLITDKMSSKTGLLNQVMSELTPSERKQLSLPHLRASQ